MSRIGGVDREFSDASYSGEETPLLSLKLHLTEPFFYSHPSSAVQQKADTLQNKIDAITGGAEAAQTLEQQQQQQMLQQMNGMGGMMNGGMGMMGMGGFGMQDIMASCVSLPL